MLAGSKRQTGIEANHHFVAFGELFPCRRDGELADMQNRKVFAPGSTPVGRVDDFGFRGGRNGVLRECGLHARFDFAIFALDVTRHDDLFGFQKRGVFAAIFQTGVLDLNAAATGIEKRLRSQL